MEGFRNPTGLARAATIALCAYMILKTLTAALSVIDRAPSEDPFLGLAALGYVVSLVACYILVGMWIYRTNSNAHIFSGAMTITPGWSIGWFFVPFANLVMPYRGVQETWQESHQMAGRYEDADSPLLGWWWGLWIANNIASNILAFIFGGSDPDAQQGAAVVNLIAAGISVAASLVLIQLMRRLNDAQLAASNGSVFA